MVESNSDLLDGFGVLKKHKYDKVLERVYESVQNPPKTVPYAKRDAVYNELQRMMKLGVVTSVKEPTEWVNSMAIAHKSDGNIRICIDPKDLNKAIRHEHYPMATLEDIAARIPKTQFFSRVDASNGYWQIKLSERASKLTTFNTPFGKFHFLVMPFGMSSASEIWHRAMVDEFGYLDGVEIAADDILIWGENHEQHDERLEKFFKGWREAGLPINPRQCFLWIAYNFLVMWSATKVLNPPMKIYNVSLECLIRQTKRSLRLSSEWLHTLVSLFRNCLVKLHLCMRLCKKTCHGIGMQSMTRPWLA